MKKVLASVAIGAVLTSCGYFWKKSKDDGADAGPPQPGIKATKVIAGADATCAITDKGGLSCWGRGIAPVPTPIDYQAEGRKVIDVALSGIYFQAPQILLLDDGTMLTQGHSGGGFSKKINLAIDKKAIAVNSTESEVERKDCAILNDGTAMCWSDDEKASLVDIGTNRTAKALSSGALHMCALLDDGAVKCWGRNDFGQLGDGTTEYRDTNSPSVVSLGEQAISLTSKNTHSCALLKSGSVKCWGSEVYFLKTLSLSPIEIAIFKDETKAIAIQTGENHICGVFEDGTIKCWGNNSSGQLGDGSKILKDAPSLVKNFDEKSRAVSLTAGRNHTCALIEDQSIRCWGENLGGQIGDGTATNRLTPVTTK